MKKKNLFALALATIISASAIAGCGAKEQTSDVNEETAVEETTENAEDAAAEEASEETTEEATEEATAEAGTKKLVAGATTGFFGAESLDVANNWDGWLMSIFGISENLFRLDSNFAPQPWLVSDYKQVDDTTWVFTIKDGVKFSNGTDVDAQAVKDCFERTYANNDRADSTLSIESMEADGQDFTIKTTQPNPTILNDLCDPLLGIYDANAEVDEVLGVSCTGPYVAKEFTAMSEVKMVKNEYYWGGEPKLDEVELKILDDTNALQMALQNGEIDMIAQLDASSTKLFTGDDNFVVEGVTSTRSDFLMYNLNTKGLDDQAVRYAIGYCIDRDNFANVVYEGYATSNYGIYPEGIAYGGTDGLDIPVDKYDVEKAKEILAEAGYTDSDNDGILDKDGEKLSFNAITYSYNDASIQLGDMLQSSLKEAGIELNITTYDVLDEYLADGAFDIAILSYAMAPTGTPQYFVNMLFTTDASNNYAGYSNATVDELAGELATEFDLDKQTEIAKKICQEVVTDRPFDFVIHQQLICVWNKKVSGVTVNPTEYYLIDANIDVEE